MPVHTPLLLAQVIVDALRVGLVVAMLAMLVGLYRVGRASRRAPAAPRGRSRLIDLASDGALGLAALALIGVLVVLFTCGYDGGAAKRVTPGFLEVTRDGEDPICGPLDPGGAAILVEVVHSDDKQRWMEGAASEFMRRCPQIQLQLTALDDLDAADAILRGDRRPTLWSPLDDLSLRYLADRWTARSDERLLRVDEQRPLLNSPLVLLLWEDRLRALATIRGEGGDAERVGPGFWVDVSCPRVPLAASGSPLPQAMLVPGGWREWYESRFPPPAPPPPQARAGTGARLTAAPPALPPEDPQAGALQAWGRVKFAAASPAHSTSGAAVLFLMALQYMSTTRLGDTAGFAAALERDADELQGWLRRCQAGLDGPETSRGLAQMLLDIGPSGLDGVFTYEHLAVPVLRQMSDPGLPELRVLYPQPTLVANHPAVLLWPDDPQQTAARDAARRWLDFLESDAVQLDAVPLGLRPAKLTGSVGGLDLIDNPFRELRRFGVETDPMLTEPERPDGRSFHALLELWQAATGRG